MCKYIHDPILVKIFTKILYSPAFRIIASRDLDLWPFDPPKLISTSMNPNTSVTEIGQNFLHWTNNLWHTTILCSHRINFRERETNRKIKEILCHQMSDFKAKMHKIRFPLGLRPRPRLQRSPEPLSWKGPTSQGRKGKRKGGEGKRRIREKGKKGKRRGGKGKGLRAWYLQFLQIKFHIRVVPYVQTRYKIR